MTEFTLFYGKSDSTNGIFSQWHLCEFTVNGIKYNCAEQFMMAEKARLFNDLESLNKILKSNSPSVQKYLGRKVKGFIPSEWDKVARNIVYKGNYAKFTQNKKLKEELLKTEGILVEASPTDKIWGIGRDIKDPLALNKSTWNGKNWLGEVPTKVREDIITGKESTVFSWN